MLFSIVTPSYKPLDWLRLCVASVRDQVTAGDGGMRDNPEFQIPNSKFQIPQLMVEHIIQDAGSPGIEDFAREIGADFYRDGQLIFSGKNGDLECEPILARPTATGSPKGEIASQIRSAELSEETSHSKSQIPSLESAPSAKSSSPIPNSNFQIPNYSIAIYSERDEGMYDAINRGLAKAKGDVIAYLNCDEQYLEGSLGEVQRFLENDRQADVVFGDALLVDGEGKAVAYRRIVRPRRMHTRLCHLCTLSCAMFLRRAVIEGGARFPTEYRAIGDAVFVDELLARGVRMRTTQTPLATYALTGANLSDGLHAKEESARWRKSGPYPSWASGICKIAHRLRRLLAGGYKRRSLDYALYTFSSPDSRARFACSSLGFAWPGASG